MARQYFPGKDAVGQQIKLGSPSSTDPWYTVIGVVADVKNNELANGIKPQLYQTYSQLGPLFALGVGKTMVLVVKATSDPATLTSAVRATIARLDPELPVTDLQNGPGAGGGVARAGVVSDRVGGVLRRAGAAAGGDRNLRRGVLGRDAADPGDRRTHGAGCEPRRCVETGDRPRDDDPFFAASCWAWPHRSV